MIFILIGAALFGIVFGWKVAVCIVGGLSLLYGLITLDD